MKKPIDKNQNRKKSYTAEKHEEPFTLLKRIALTENVRKLMGEPLMKNQKLRKKVAQCRTSPKGDSLVSKRFEDTVNSTKNSKRVLFSLIGHPLEL